MGNLILQALVLCCILSCGSKIPFSPRPIPVKFEANLDVSLAGTVTLTGGTSLELSKLKTKPYILILAGETCETCLEEASALVELFQKEGGIPTNVDLYTVILGGFIEDAESWAQAIGLQWAYGIDPNQDQIFRKYCTGLTPCVLAVDPVLKKYTRFIGSSSFEDWQKETLKWEY
jgi:hypothetical protein